MDNPLLNLVALPDFAAILPEHFLKAIEDSLQRGRMELGQLLAQRDYRWKSLVVPLAELNEQALQPWKIIEHLNAVKGSKAIREAYEECLPLVVDYITEFSQHAGIYQAFRQLADSDEYPELDSIQRKIVDDRLRDLRLAGVELAEDQQRYLVELQQNLAQLEHKFACNVLDATQNFWLELSADEVGGLPESALALGRNNALKREANGWWFNLDYPAYDALITFADSRRVRERVYQAYVTRASELVAQQRQWDNSSLILEILEIRRNIAQLLSFSCYAEFSLATKMAPSVEAVEKFLETLTQNALPAARQELAQLIELAKSAGVEQLEPWDVAYYVEKLQQQQLQISQEQLRAYFPITRVLHGMFALVEQLYGIQVKERKGVAVWSDEVGFFEIYDQQQQLRGQFYLDLYVREGKRGGAWADSYRDRSLVEGGSLRIPVAFLVCNFAAPATGEMALLTHDDLLTLLHEFGHVLQYLLTTMDHLDVAGVNGVPWDAVELASQLMENWGWHREGLQFFAQHYETGEGLPSQLLEKLQHQRTFNAAIRLLRQIEFAQSDWQIHRVAMPFTAEYVQEIIQQVYKNTQIIVKPTYVRSLHSFTHIFAGGYAAGYYSYLWAEVLAADAFSRFEQEGVLNSQVGRDFLTAILERGGSEDPLKLFRKFRGRDPSLGAMLAQHGIVVKQDYPIN